RMALKTRGTVVAPNAAAATTTARPAAPITSASVLATTPAAPSPTRSRSAFPAHRCRFGSLGWAVAAGSVDGIALKSDYLGWFEYQTSPALLESSPIGLFAQQFYGSGGGYSVYEQVIYFTNCVSPPAQHSFPTRRSSDLRMALKTRGTVVA